MKTIFITMLAMMLSAVFAAVSFGGYGMDYSEPEAVDTGDNAGVVSATSGGFVGMEVKNVQGETIGQITDLIMDEKSGDISLAVISGGETMSASGKSFTVPFAAFEPGIEVETLQLTVDESLLANSPVRETGMSNGEFSRSLQEYYGLAPQWDEAEKALDTKGGAEKKMME